MIGLRKILGVDLAGKEDNPTGICYNKEDKIKCGIVYSDEEILRFVLDFKPDIVAIDAPLMEGMPRVRRADRSLKKYGAMPPTLPSMRFLTLRGYRLAARIKNGCRVIEVFPTATAKILDVYDRDYKNMVSKLDISVENKHELDAYLCFLTARLFLEGKTVEVGDEDGRVVVPEEPGLKNL